MATSKAMGTGRNAETRATRRMPPMVTWARSAWGGKSATTNAPRMAARIMSGRATRATYQKLLAKERATPAAACGQVSAEGISMGHGMAVSSSFWREATVGAKTKIRKRTVASLMSAMETGKSAKVMARTTTFSAGEENMVARTDSALMPETKSPRAIGAIQLEQTAKGTPAAAPKSVL